VKNGRLVLAYDSSGKEILFSEDIKGNVELNPLLEKYFYLDNIISANIKYSLVGSEIPDPLKFNYTIKDSNGTKENIFVSRLNKKGFKVTEGIKENLRKLDLTQLYYYIKKLKKVSSPEAQLLESQLSEVYTEIS
jgi:hypothetical protein